MNRNLIGNENLPNLYISQVSVSDTSSQAANVGTKVKIEFMFNNSLGANRRPMFDYSSGREPVEIIMLCVYDTYTFNALLNTRTEREQQEVIREQISNGNVRQHTVALPPLKMNDLMVGKITPTYIRKEITLNANVNNLQVLAKFQKGNKHGPVVSEAILQNGIVVKESFILKIKNTNQIWTGPIHEHNGVLMGGSFHTEEPHPTLVKVKSENYKIKDLRQLKEPISAEDNISGLIQTENNFFSEVKHSQAENGAVNFMFSINTKEMLINSSKYSSILKQYSEQIFSSVARQATIKSLYIYFTDAHGKTRYAIDTRQDNNTAMSTKVYKDSLTKTPRKTSSPLPSESIYSIIEEVKFSNDRNIRTFRCQLHEKNVSSLKVVVEIKDPFETYLYKMLQEAKKQNNQIKTYSALLKRRDVFDRNTGRFKQRRLADKYDNRIDYWYRPVDAYMKINCLVNKMTSQQNSDEAIKAFESIAPRSCTPSSVDNFVDKFSRVLNLFISKYSLRANTQRSTTPSGGNNGRHKRHTFKKQYNIHYKHNNRAFSCFEYDDENFQVPIFTADQFQAVLINEGQKFSSTTSRYEQARGVSTEVVESANSDEYERHFLTPLRLQNFSNTFVFSDISMTTEDSISSFSDISILDSLDLKSLFGKNISVRVYEEEESSTQDTSEILGPTSNFQSLPNLFSRQVSSTSVPLALLRGMGSQENGNYSLFNKLDLSTNNNFLSGKTVDSASRIPLQHKFLSNKAKMSSLFSSIENFINNKPHLNELAFFNIQKIIFESRYQKDSNNRIILGKTIKQEMSETSLQNINKPIICHLASYEDQQLYKKNNFLNDYAKMNSFFVVVPNSYISEIPIESVSFLHSAVLSDAYRKYASTSLYETQYLRNSANREHQERERSMPRTQTRRRRTGLSQRATRRAQRAQEQQTTQRQDRYSRNDQKMRTMVDKTVTDDNKTTDQMLRTNEPEQAERLDTNSSTDEQSRTQNRPNETRRDNRPTRRTNRSARRTGGSSRRRGGNNGY